MKKFSKTKQGFTLIEMIIVIAIIVILISVLIASLLQYIDKAKNGTSKMQSYYDVVSNIAGEAGV